MRSVILCRSVNRSLIGINRGLIGNGAKRFFACRGGPDYTESTAEAKARQDLVARNKKIELELCVKRSELYRKYRKYRKYKIQLNDEEQVEFEKQMTLHRQHRIGDILEHIKFANTYINAFDYQLEVLQLYESMVDDNLKKEIKEKIALINNILSQLNKQVAMKKMIDREIALDLILDRSDDFTLDIIEKQTKLVYGDVKEFIHKLKNTKY